MKTISTMRPEDVRSLRDLGRYVAENADKILIPTEDGSKPLSKLSTVDALRWQASIIESGKVPSTGEVYRAF